EAALRSAQPLASSAAYLPNPGYGGTFDYPLSSTGYGTSLEEQSRHNDPRVVEFRKKLGPYLFVNAIILLAAIFGFTDLFPITVLWSIYIAYRYARLWQDNFDWRDVFRQPREKELIDVADEGIESMKAVFDREKRQELRAQRRERMLVEREAAARRSAASPAARFAAPGQGAPGYDAGLAGMRRTFGDPPSSVPTGRGPSPLPAPLPLGGALPAQPSAGPPALEGAARDRVMQAKNQLDDVYRMVDQLPREQREMLRADVKGDALALAERIRQLTVQLGELDQALGRGEQQRIERQIAEYEAQANPLEPESESRIRQLVALKRHRRALAEKASRRPTVARQVEECELALGMMRSHLARLVTSPSYAGAPDPAYQQVTQLVERALSMADRVDGALHAVEEVDRVAPSRPPGR
ncbi:MAG TPA: hypothetical protein VEA99_18885, partial [Gemmatimonadaceae bacterium]|nr:hypothetical protein [Gemmatimonadaceae bacterium]